MARKIDHYLAIRDSYHDVASQAWDMMRYDRCYPASNTPSGWIVFIQPYRESVRGGFTIDRWTSFGFRNIVTGTAPTSSGIPSEMYRHMIELNAERDRSLFSSITQKATESPE